MGATARCRAGRHLGRDPRRCQRAAAAGRPGRGRGDAGRTARAAATSRIPRRAGPRADLDAVVAVICRVGALAARIGDELESLEINPLYVRGAQVEALDVTV